MDNSNSQQSSTDSLKFQAFSWAFVGLSVTLTSPVDFVRVRLQVMPELVKLGRLDHPYKGGLDCARRVLKKQGYRAFWKGNLSMLCRVVPMETLVFSLKEKLQKAFHYHHRFSESKHFIINSAIGMTSSLFISFTLYPFEYVRQKLVNRVGQQKVGIFQQMKKTVRTKGFKELYHGGMLSLGAGAVWRGIYFGIYDSLKVKTENQQLRFSFCYLALLVGTLFTCPVDCVRRRKVANPKSYSGILDVFRKIYRHEGVMGFYNGWPMIFVQCVSMALFFFLYDGIFTDYKAALAQ